ncbi:MAG: hypothetical protein EB059_08340, partial [Alphaproteobacteria bacterium]|nr:hypothetical protein [Alphaproteobacteria bacterium]
STKKEQERTLPERTLLDAIERISMNLDGRVAVHIHLSKLQQHNRRNYYLRIASDTFKTQLAAYGGHIFTLSNHDLFFLCKDVEPSVLTNAVDRLRPLFAQDPLTQYNATDDEQDGFVTYYQFTEQYEMLHQDVLTLYKSMERTRKTKEISTHGKPFIPSDLSKLISILERADLTNILRRQTACRMTSDGIPKPFFQEAYISIDDLQKICTPDIDLLSDRWLFHYLTRTLDKRLLTVMANSGITPDMPFSMNLNIQTLLSPEFTKFDALVPLSLRGKTVIELHKVDVFSDIGAYMFARDFVRERGYLLCLDGLTQHTLPFFEKNKLGLDYYKIYWGADGLKIAGAQTLADTKNLLAEFGENRIILCRCDNDDAITVGRELGFIQFQGRMIDRLLGLTKK